MSGKGCAEGNGLIKVLLKRFVPVRAMIMRAVEMVHASGVKGGLRSSKQGITMEGKWLKGCQNNLCPQRERMSRATMQHMLLEGKDVKGCWYSMYPYSTRILRVVKQRRPLEGKDFRTVMQHVPMKGKD